MYAIALNVVSNTTILSNGNTTDILSCGVNKIWANISIVFMPFNLMPWVIANEIELSGITYSPLILAHCKMISFAYERAPT